MPKTCPDCNQSFWNMRTDRCSKCADERRDAQRLRYRETEAGHGYIETIGGFGVTDQRVAERERLVAKRVAVRMSAEEDRRRLWEQRARARGAVRP